MTIAVMLVGMLALALLNVPIAVALGIVAILIIQDPNSLPNMALVMFDGAQASRCSPFRCSSSPAPS